jgi:ankyrin repeat protein
LAVARKQTDAAAAMLRAANGGDATAIRTLIDGDASLVHVRDEHGSTPLHRAAWKGHLEAARVLIAAGADVNAQDRQPHYGGTPLHTAAHGNQRSVADLLIAHGADVAARNAAGRTPLDETTAHKATPVARLLREHGATA